MSWTQFYNDEEELVFKELYNLFSEDSYKNILYDYNRIIRFEHAGKKNNFKQADIYRSETLKYINKSDYEDFSHNYQINIYNLLFIYKYIDMCDKYYDEYYKIHSSIFKYKYDIDFKSVTNKNIDIINSFKCDNIKETLQCSTLLNLLGEKMVKYINV